MLWGATTILQFLEPPLMLLICPFFCRHSTAQPCTPFSPTDPPIALHSLTPAASFSATSTALKCSFQARSLFPKRDTFAFRDMTGGARIRYVEPWKESWN
jgi:hypothetical protein